MGAPNTPSVSLRELVKTYETSFSYIRDLLDGGIPECDLQDVLDIRDCTTVLGSVATDTGSIYGSCVVAVSAEQLVKLYHMAEGDLDAMAEMAERARDDFYAQKYISRGLKEAFDKVIKAGLVGRYEYPDE